MSNASSMTKLIHRGYQRSCQRGQTLHATNPKAKAILEKIKALNLDNDFIFMRDSQPLATVTFNRKLKKCCEELGIECRSSHKLRFSTASIMHKNGINDTELQKLLGHTSLTMTQHYLRNITPNDENAAKMNAILG